MIHIPWLYKLSATPVLTVQDTLTGQLNCLDCVIFRKESVSQTLTLHVYTSHSFEPQRKYKAALEYRLEETT